MNTDPQTPQASRSTEGAEGSQSHPHPVAEGRQSPGLAALLAEAEKVDTADIVDDYKRGFAVGRVAGLSEAAEILAAPGAPPPRRRIRVTVDGDHHAEVMLDNVEGVTENMLVATFAAALKQRDASRRATAGVDLEADFAILDGFLSDLEPGWITTRFHSDKVKPAWSRLVARLRAQAPASSPRPDLSTHPCHSEAARIYSALPPSGLPVEETPIANRVALKLFSYAYGLETEIGRLHASSPRDLEASDFDAYWGDKGEKWKGWLDIKSFAREVWDAARAGEA